MYDILSLGHLELELQPQAVLQRRLYVSTLFPWSKYNTIHFPTVDYYFSRNIQLRVVYLAQNKYTVKSLIPRIRPMYSRKTLEIDIGGYLNLSPEPVPSTNVSILDFLFCYIYCYVCLLVIIFKIIFFSLHYAMGLKCAMEEWSMGA